jgi:hypothetical protein
MWIWSGCVAPSVGFFPGQSACTGDCIYRASTFASCSNCRTNGLTNKNKTYKKKRTSLWTSFHCLVDLLSSPWSDCRF